MDATVLSQPPCAVQTTCATCRQRGHCLPAALSGAELDRVGQRMVLARRSVARGAALFRAGHAGTSVFAVHSGFFKTCMLSRDGTEHVTGFQIAGELVGLDALGTANHRVEAIALEDSQVCVIPLAGLEQITRDVARVQQQLHRIVGHEFVRQQQMMSVLGNHSADERLAAFLLELLQRMRSRGHPASTLLLRMSREDIGSFLGLTVETVSRTFSRFQSDGLLGVHQRQIRFVDTAGLQRLVDSGRGD